MIGSKVHKVEALKPFQAKKILEGMPTARLQDRKLHAMLVIGLAEGPRLHDLLTMRMKQRAELPGLVKLLTNAYFEEMEYVYGIQEKDLMFPDLLWRDMNRDLPWTTRNFVHALRAAARDAGLDTSAVISIWPATWRQTAALIRLAGSFETFAADLSVPVWRKPSGRRGRSGTWAGLTL